MTPASPPQPFVAGTRASDDTAASEAVDTFVWIEEHDWLYALLGSETNVAPRFRVPDLLSACVSQVLGKENGVGSLFGYLGAELIMRAPGTPRRKESMWRAQYVQLQALQRSAANRYPHPQFQLDQFTTACVALARREDDSGACTLRHARINIIRRTAIGKALISG
ncbi:MAG: hypothetical protein WAQ05_13225 [Rubrivivax sp.]|jgi:hypothetical protein